MRHLDSEKVVAVAEKSIGNAEVGEMWLETAIFDPSASVREIMQWAKDINCNGRLILTWAIEK